MTTALQADGLVRSFGSRRALGGVSFAVQQGELYGLVGPDGAGKTTCIRAVAGLIKLDAGRVEVLGADPVREGRKVREAMGLMPQYYSLYGDLSVQENLQFFGRLYGLRARVYERRVARLLEMTRLEPFVDRRADALSGGMYKKLALACALLHQPEVLLLDEPTNGVDPVSRRELWALLYEFVADGMAVFVSTPSMDEAERCHRVGLLYEGELLVEGPPLGLVAELPYQVLEVSGVGPEPLERALAGQPWLVSSSPAGARLRVVVQPEGVEALSQILPTLRAEGRKARLSFEDLFLLQLASRRETGEGR